MSRPDLSVDFAGVRLKNPVALASGTCGFGRELAERIDLSRLGAICSKGLTLRARDGNAGERLRETPSGLLNSIGLENPGVEAFIERELPFMNGLGTAVIVNVGGHCEADYIEAIERLDSERFDMLELNISCPNVRSGGMAYGATPEAARAITRRARAACRRPMIVKLTPNAGDITTVARACEEEGADGLSLVNTFLGMAIDIDAGRPVFDNVFAGLSGPAIKPLALRMVWQVCRAVSVPVFGLGGISTWRDAAEFLAAGAAAVQVGTATLVRPNAALDIVDGLEALMSARGMTRVADLRIRV